MGTKINPADLYDIVKRELPADHIDHHESDLYVKCTPESRKIIQGSGIWHEVFIDQLTHSYWYDIPFCYSPFWAERAKYRKERGLDL